ncbi:hypothetical protein ATANTOWER_024138 [Ataeniobius toweri]|uniref:Uncharacterized protein n=1 Tax=Ataeniobius toweri TaxID=208326 RepID=A0ABU7CA87_9TELE|nr:hypothetical protein [Ataeniobius toweri]
MSLCWQTDINSSTGSKDVIRSSIICKDKPAETNCPREVPYRETVSMKPSGASPSLEGRQQRPHHHGYGNSSVVGGQNGRLSSTAKEVS